MARFAGRIVFVTPTYGFLTGVHELNGDEKAPRQPDVFLRASVLRESFGKGRHSLKRLEGQSLSFQTRESALHHGKIEACSLKGLPSYYIP